MASLSCVVDSENPQHWAEAIKNVRHKSREIRYKECETLRMHYDEKYNWEKQCTELVDIILPKLKVMYLTCRKALIAYNLPQIMLLM